MRRSDEERRDALLARIEWYKKAQTATRDGDKPIKHGTRYHKRAAKIALLEQKLADLQARMELKASYTKPERANRGVYADKRESEEIERRIYSKLLTVATVLKPGDGTYPKAMLYNIWVGYAALLGIPLRNERTEQHELTALIHYGKNSHYILWVVPVPHGVEELYNARGIEMHTSGSAVATESVTGNSTHAGSVGDPHTDQGGWQQDAGSQAQN